MKEIGENFHEVINQDSLVLVDFWANWCGPCLVLKNTLPELTGVEVYTLDIDDHPDPAAEFGVTSLPTLIFFRGGEVVGKIVGLVPASEIQSKIDDLQN